MCYLLTWFFPWYRCLTLLCRAVSSSINSDMFLLAFVFLPEVHRCGSVLFFTVSVFQLSRKTFSLFHLWYLVFVFFIYANYYSMSLILCNGLILFISFQVQHKSHYASSTCSFDSSYVILFVVPIQKHFSLVEFLFWVIRSGIVPGNRNRCPPFPMAPSHIMPIIRLNDRSALIGN